MRRWSCCVTPLMPNAPQRDARSSRALRYGLGPPRSRLSCSDDDSDDEIRLVRAEAIVQSGEREDVAESVHALDELVERADERLRLAAAFSRLVASAHHIGVPWSESAEALLRADNATIADIVHADGARPAGRA